MEFVTILVMAVGLGISLGYGLWLVMVEDIGPLFQRFWRKAREAMASFIEPLIEWLDELDPEALANFTSAMSTCSCDPFYPASSFPSPYTNRLIPPRP